MTKLYSWNVNGLRACMEKGFREFLEREQPDVLCLQETKMQPHQADFDFPGYIRFPFFKTKNAPAFPGNTSFLIFK